MEFPFDAERLARLARRDLTRACRHFLERCGSDASRIAARLEVSPPPDWPPDLAPVLSWVAATSGDAPLSDRFFAPATMIASPMVCTIIRLNPGDVIRGDLVRNAGNALFILPSEGDRLIAVASATFILGTHLGYRRVDQETLRARRVRGAEQEAIRRTWEILGALRDTRPGDPALRLFEYRFEQLLRCPNHDMPATMQWLETLPLPTQRRLWTEVLQHVQRATLPPGRVPTLASLRQRAGALTAGIDTVHLSRLLRVAQTWADRLQPDPDVASGHVQASRAAIDEYLAWEHGAEHLRSCLETRGLPFINEALTQLALGVEDPSWPEGFSSDLVEFRETFLKRIQARPIRDLEAVDPVRHLALQLAQDREKPAPDTGDPRALVQAWQSLEADVRRSLDRGPVEADRETPGRRGVEPVSGWQEAEFSSAQEFFDIDDDEFPTIDIVPEGESLVPASSSAGSLSSPDGAGDGATRAPLEPTDAVLEHVASQLENLGAPEPVETPPPMNDAPAPRGPSTNDDWETPREQERRQDAERPPGAEVKPPPPAP